MFANFAQFCQHYQRFRRVTDYIGSHLDDEQLRITDLAEVAHLSAAHLLRLYQQRIGESPMQTVRRLRLQQAYAHLHDPTRSITQIAFDAGYDSNAAFSHAFRRQFLMSARQVRQSQPTDIPPLQARWTLAILPAQKVWQFRYDGCYADNGHYKARLAWVCLSAGCGQWLGWRLNDRDAPFEESPDHHVSLTHFVPASAQPANIAEADLASMPGGLYALACINPAECAAHVARLPDYARSVWGCALDTERAILERDLHRRDYRAPQERRIALYVPLIRQP